MHPNNSDCIDCIVCKSPLAKDALKCPKCKSYQQKWKNSIRQLAAIVLFLTAIPSLIVFLVTEIPNAWEVLFPKYGVEILNFASEKKITIQNTGSKKILVSHVKYGSQDPQFTFHQMINVEVPSGDIVIHFLPSTFNNLEFFTPYKLEEWRNALLTASGGGECYYVTVFHPEDPLWLEATSIHGDSLRSFSVNGELYFYTGSNNELQSVSFDALGTVKLDLECIEFRQL